MKSQRIEIPFALSLALLLVSNMLKIYTVESFEKA